MNLTEEQDHIILHSSGLSSSKEQYRDHYCCRATNPDLLALVELGLMAGPHKNAMLPDGSAYFTLTAAGIDRAWELSGRKRPKTKRKA